MAAPARGTNWEMTFSRAATGLDAPPPIRERFDARGVYRTVMRQRIRLTVSILYSSPQAHWYDVEQCDPLVHYHVRDLEWAAFIGGVRFVRRGLLPGDIVPTRWLPLTDCVPDLSWVCIEIEPQDQLGRMGLLATFEQYLPGDRDMLPTWPMER